MTPEDRTELPQPLPPPTSAKDSRRRLLRGGLAAAPALLTLVNRPVMAAPCLPGSASVSANMSRGNTPPNCEAGRGTETWGKETSFMDWPAPMAIPGDTKARASQPPAEPAATSGDKKGKGDSPSTLSDVAAAPEQIYGSKPTTFGSVFGTRGGYEKATLLEVLRLNSNVGRDGLAKHLVAAYLNALKGYTPAVVLDVVTVKNIWASYVARGYYEPTAGIRWFPDYAEPANPRGGLIAWIKTTMPR